MGFFFCFWKFGNERGESEEETEREEERKERGNILFKGTPQWPI